MMTPKKFEQLSRALAVLGRRGVITFQTQAEAEHYLTILPEFYHGRVYRSWSGGESWVCSYRLVAA